MKYYFSKVKILKIAFFGILVFVFFYLKDEGLLYHWFLDILFVFFLFRVITWLLRRGPVVVIDENGIVDYGSRYGFIPWEDIKSLQTVESGFRKILCINVRDSSIYLSKVLFYKRFLSKMSQSFGFLDLSPKIKATCM